MEEFKPNASFELLVDNDEVNNSIYRNINAVFGSDFTNLSKAQELVIELTQVKDELENKLRFASTEAPDKIFKAVHDADNALDKGKSLIQQCSNLEVELVSHSGNVDGLLSVLAPRVRELRELERQQAYQQCVQAVHEQSGEIESALNVSAEAQAMSGFVKLSDTAHVIRDSKCHHLVAFVNVTVVHWHSVLQKRFAKELEELLKVLKWPFTSSNLSATQTPPADNHLQRLDTLLQYLLQLSLPSCIPSPEAINPSSPLSSHSPLMADFEPPFPPLDIFVHPLEIRFFFHFTQNKGTNSRENPEWYFTQVLKWISAHEKFLSMHVQPVLNRTGHGTISAKVEFMRGLVRLVLLKLATDLPEVQFDDDNFCHTVQETLNFEHELTTCYGYPSSQPSILKVLTTANHFSKWIHVERKFAVEIMDELVSMGDAWTTCEGSDSAQCGERLIVLLQGITDRYKRLPQPGHRLQFLELQLDLLDDFRVRVIQMTKAELHDPLRSNYAAILNTVHYVSEILQDWADLPFFVEMQYYREQFKWMEKRHLATLENLQLPGSPDDISNFSFELDSQRSPLMGNPEAAVRQEAFDILNRFMVPTSVQLSFVDGSVFKTTLELYCHIETAMLRSLVDRVYGEVKGCAQPYRKDRWFGSGSSNIAGKSEVISEPSPSLCPLLEVLARQCHTVRDILISRLFNEFWKMLAEKLNNFIYEEVVLQNHFSEMGSLQFKFDMTRGLFPIFGEFTPKPENFFRKIKESILLLTLPRPTALLLRETLRTFRMEEHDMSHFTDSISSPIKTLSEMKVTLLSPLDAETILNIRTNMAT